MEIFLNATFYNYFESFCLFELQKTDLTSSIWFCLFFWWGFFRGHLVVGQIKIYSTSKGVTAKSVAGSFKSIFYKARCKMDYQHWQKRKWAAAFFTIYILNFTIWWPCEVFGDYCNKTLLLFHTYFVTVIIGFSLWTDVTCLRYNSERMYTEEKICFCKEDIR